MNGRRRPRVRRVARGWLGALAALAGFAAVGVPSGRAAADEPATEAAAAPVEPPDPWGPPAPRGRWTIQGTASGSWSPAVGLEDDRGDLAARRGGFDVLTTYDVSPRWTLGFDLGAERSTYDFSAPDLVVAGTGRLFEEGTTAYVTPGVRYRPDDDWTFATALTVATGFAPGANVLDGGSVSVVATVKRRVSPSLAVLVGGLYSTSIEDDPTVIPIVVLSGEGKSTGPLRFEFRGAGIRAARPLSSRVAVAVSARYVRREFRLAEDDRLPEGVFRDVRVPVSLELDLLPTPDVRITGAVGWNVYTDVVFDDRHGHEVVDAVAVPGLWFGLSATIRF